jgi:hypothetical protein
MAKSGTISNKYRDYLNSRLNADEDQIETLVQDLLDIYRSKMKITLRAPAVTADVPETDPIVAIPFTEPATWNAFRSVMEKLWKNSKMDGMPVTPINTRGGQTKGALVVAQLEVTWGEEMLFGDLKQVVLSVSAANFAGSGVIWNMLSDSDRKKIQYLGARMT